MTGYAGTANVNNMRHRASAGASRRTGKKTRIRRSDRNLFIFMAAVVLAVFILAALSAYAASIQHANNVLEAQNASLQAEIDSLNSQIVEETKVTKVESIATKKYGMVYPTSDNCIYIDENGDSGQNLAATIRSEAYN